MKLWSCPLMLSCIIFSSYKLTIKAMTTYVSSYSLMIIKVFVVCMCFMYSKLLRNELCSSLTSHLITPSKNSVIVCVDMTHTGSLLLHLSIWTIPSLRDLSSYLTVCSPFVTAFIDIDAFLRRIIRVKSRHIILNWLQDISYWEVRIQWSEILHVVNDGDN